MEAIDKQIAVISDVHGNSLALRAVLDDIARRGIERVLNLGDSLYGPLDPAGTADIIIARKIPSVLGNEDRIILESFGAGGGVPGEDGGEMEGKDAGHDVSRDRSSADGSAHEDARNPSLQFTLSCLTKEHIDWLWSLSQELRHDPGLYLCHGSPVDDTEYLLWEVDEASVQKRGDEAIIERLGGIEARVILCGHDHLQGERRLSDGRLVIDPGSVGLPAYADDTPYPHSMESGSPHARYTNLHWCDSGWAVEHLKIEYDWESASRMAAENGRKDWAHWLLNGKAAPTDHTGT